MGCVNSPVHVSEDLRLLHGGLTCARDTLVLVHDPATVPNWLDIANARDLLAAETAIISLAQVRLFA